LKFTRDHEWIRVEGDEATVGITSYAQDQLGDIVFVDLPEAGRALVKGEEFAVIESVKAASEVYAPVSGTVAAANEALAESPALVNESPDGDGWLVRLTLSNPAELDELLDADAYQRHLADLG
jgi:glycine cleavage system H protein